MHPLPKPQPSFLSLLSVAGFSVAAILLFSLAGGCQGPQSASTSAFAPTSAKAATAPAPGPVPPSHASALAEFHNVIQPILKERCYDCHGDGESRAGVAFDKLTTEDQILQNPDLWLKVIKNTRAHIMPPNGHDGPTPAEQQTLDNWIKYSAFRLDPHQLDPGRITVHRLNRVEYKNSIHDLTGINFETQTEFPGDDSGYGFDNIADVLNMSPLLMEKYLTAAQSIVDQVMKNATRVPAQQVAGVKDFIYDDGTPTDGTDIRGSGLGANAVQGILLSFVEAASVTHDYNIIQSGDYRLELAQNLRGDFNYDTQHCMVTVTVDGKQISRKDFGWQNNLDVDDSFNVHLETGKHTLLIALAPVLPLATRPRASKGATEYNLKTAKFVGPLDPKLWPYPAGYARVYTRPETPSDSAGRHAYTREILSTFATRAFRTPVPAESLDQLVSLAETSSSAPGGTFEGGVSHALVAVLASPRFLFRVERPVATTVAPAPFALVDEYSLASRLSYFLWSTTPDDELNKLAASGQLRANLAAQVKRLLADPRSSAFVENFTGQWLQSRLVTTVPLNPHEILLRQGQDTSPKLTDAQRAAFKQEPEQYFAYVAREDRSVDEFLSSDYTFANETLAASYSLPGVKGPEFRKVTLPAGDWHGGMLTMGSVMMVTSNPTRTSPVKRGKWMLENILGSPTPPPPPNIPALEDAKPKTADHVPTLRETLAVHRQDALCASCHDRMDPLGLAFENFNALGQIRTVDQGSPVETSGQLATGEKFADIRELRQILVTDHKVEFYRCLTEKLLTYSLGRGLEYYDVPTVDKIVADLDRTHGEFSSLLLGVVNSVPFQEQRTFPNPVPSAAKPASTVAETNPTHEDVTLR